MSFLSREEAGQKLGQLLLDKKVEVDVVLGLPRGGVIVAAEVARMLERPLDVLVVRKIGHPWNREFAVGALAEDDTLVLDGAMDLADSRELDDVMAEERERLAGYCAKFHEGKIRMLQNLRVLLVDDGLATGATTEAAVRCVRKRGAARVIVAIPIASDTAAARIQKVADDVLAVIVDPSFMAVGQYYRHFPQSTDEEVIALLQKQPQPRKEN